MDTQSLYETLYIFLDWHPARIQTFGELIWSVVQTRTVRLKELALHVTSKPKLVRKSVKFSKISSYYYNSSNQFLDNKPFL